MTYWEVRGRDPTLLQRKLEKMGVKRSKESQCYKLGLEKRKRVPKKNQKKKKNLLLVFGNYS